MLQRTFVECTIGNIASKMNSVTFEVSVKKTVVRTGVRVCVPESISAHAQRRQLDVVLRNSLSELGVQSSDVPNHITKMTI